MKQESKPKNKTHFKAGMLAGAVFGLAAGIFMSSKQGKKLASDLHKETKEIQKRLQQELKKAKSMTEDTYSAAIDKVLAYYTETKKIASKDVPELRRYLMSKWKEIQRELKHVAKH